MFNCDVVNRGKFAELFGVPVALIGLIGYASLYVITMKKKRALEILRFCMSLGGLLFAIDPAYIEEHVLQTWCLRCIGSLIAIAGAVVLSAIELLRTRKFVHGRKACSGKLSLKYASPIEPSTGLPPAHAVFARMIHRHEPWTGPGEDSGVS